MKKLIVMLLLFSSTCFAAKIDTGVSVFVDKNFSSFEEAAYDSALKQLKNLFAKECENGYENLRSVSIDVNSGYAEISENLVAGTARVKGIADCK